MGTITHAVNRVVKPNQYRERTALGGLIGAFDHAEIRPGFPSTVSSSHQLLPLCHTA